VAGGVPARETPATDRSADVAGGAARPRCPGQRL